MKERERKDGEAIIQEVAERIKLEAPHADPVMVSALITRLRSVLSYRAEDFGEPRA